MDIVGDNVSGDCESMVENKKWVVMDEGQRRILQWLRDVDAGLAELYEGCVRMIKDRSFGGRERFICHAVREIRNRLPEAVAGKHAVERLEYKEEVRCIAEAWERAGLEGVYEMQSDRRGQEPEERVAREVLVRVGRLVRRHREVEGRKEENARRLYIELEPENEQLRGSLGPVVRKWVDETEWFVQRAHVGKIVSEEELVGHFERFENVLANLVGYFYEGLEEIEGVVENANRLQKEPSKAEVDAVVPRLWRPRYRMQFFDRLENPYWIGALKDAGFFKWPAEAKEGEAYERWPEGRYLKKMCAKVPEGVLGVIKEIVSRNPYIRNTCSECLLEMPVGVAAKGGRIVENVLPRGWKEGNLEWAWVGQPCAKVMVKLIEEHPKEAFKIAWILLDVWVPKEKKLFEDIVGKFSDHDYRELVLKYYAEIWKVEPEGGFWVLVKILSRCIADLSKEKEYDVSSSFAYGMGLRNLDGIDVGHGGVKSVLVKGICEAGKVLIEKQPAKVGELLDGLEKLDSAIFKRVAMYLLRFVPGEAEVQRIKGIIGNKKYLEEPGYEFEYKLLLRDKFDVAGEEEGEAFVGWVKEEKVSEETRKEITELCTRNNEPLPDFAKMENRKKAEELYLVRERFKDVYEQYKKAAGVKDDNALARRRMVGEARFVSATEGTPLSSEAMGKMSVGEVLEFLSEPENYEGEKKAGEWRTPVDALRATFKADAKKRGLEYLREGREKLANLPAGFLSSFFYGASEAVREGSFDKEEWGLLIHFASLVVEEKHKEQEYEDGFSEILSVLREGFGGGKGNLELDEPTAKEFWEILKRLIHFPVKKINGKREERDPMQLMLRQVAGKALELTVLLGLVCKKQFEKYWEKELKEEMRKCWGYVLENIREPGVNCIFGIEFSRINWLDQDWTREKLDVIFRPELWDEIWGTYVSWGRPSGDGFKLLVGRTKYARAVDLLGQGNRFKFGKDPEEGLVEHLMIGFFNGWVEFESDLLKGFLKAASAGLRGKAAKFLTTGFKAVNEEDGEQKGEVAARMREYCQKRLAAIKGKPEENRVEAVELTGWVEDSVLGAKETLELLEESLDLSGGKIGQMGDARDFVEGVTALGKGNELLALRCLKKAAVDENMHTPWAGIQEPLARFLEGMVGLAEDVRSEAAEAADLYGRYNPEKFRAVWEELKKVK
ncbi:MAG: hypothetical protein ACYTBJ_19925 [Planctomycetota bacterium]|jgi:hypothetical protein